MKNATNISPAVRTHTTHQKAVNALLEMAIFTADVRAAMPDAELTVPRSQVPALFRAAIEEQKAARRNPYREETAILQTALMLLEQAGDENRTPTQDEFFSALTFGHEGERTFRVRYVPENVTVN